MLLSAAQSPSSQPRPLAWTDAPDRAQQPALPVLSRAAWAASTTVAIGASCGRSISIRLTPSPHCPLAEGRGRASGGARPSPRARHRRHSPCLDRARPRAARSLARGRRARPRRAAAQWSWEKRAARRGWRAASACCKLFKGPDFPTRDEIFADHPDGLKLYRIGSDGWCINYDKATRTCNIYQDRPRFCRVEPKVFDEFFGVPRNRCDREACSA
ncbi:hypothetical protein SORBI_3007G151250 [Sorghum bicolor]|uniref:YkgJ family cysteine cluster protein n=1 Tax=Sorghum bicolor TaxID=4558 RepID=A0A1Z5RA66_SORBI|nr:hypothetical protein SORBI_3007G151250 [Sorghum bicolor]